MLNDMGSQLMSELMAEISRLLLTRQLKTRPYHAIYSGLIERFKDTFKQILRRLYVERPMTGTDTELSTSAKL